jgi:dTDP-4-amino-4,6-dideoxygalactose transaminase
MRHISIGTFRFTERIRRNILDILESGRISYGPYSQKFEYEFAKLHSCKCGVVSNCSVLSNSGTSSLLVALQTLKEVHNWQDGDEVIVPAITFVATVNVVLQAGLKPVLVDVEPDYYGIDVNKIFQIISNITRCIIPVHAFGQPADMQSIKKLLRRYQQVKVIEDSCESMLVSHYNKPVGSWSDIACFSTYMAHIITTGVGGIAITNNELYAKTMRSLVNHGMSYDDLSAKKDEFDPWKLHRDFTFERVGHSFRITELEAAIGLAQLEELEKTIEKRFSNLCYLGLGLSELVDYLQLPSIRPNTQHAAMMFPIVCKQPNTRDKLTRHLNENGIETRRMLPLINQPAYKGLWNPDDYPVAKWIDENGFYIGCHQDLSQDDLDYVVEVFGKFKRWSYNGNN